MEEILMILPINKTVGIGDRYFKCVPIYSGVGCTNCIFNRDKSMSKNCPRIEGRKDPVCFATERPDKTPVYFANGNVKNV